ncbi:MAG: Nramp family divalent metal transporter [Pyrobaculum sp.]
MSNKINLGKLPIDVEERIPTPEEVFKVKKLGIREKILYLWGSALIALGVSIGSGEFLLGPSIAIRIGLMLSWLVLIGAFLQTIYIYSYTKLTIATGETPVTMFFRIGTWAGWVGALGVLLGNIWGGWAYSAAAALAGGFLGRQPTPDDRVIVGIAGFSLLLLAFVILTLGRRIARTLEIFNWFDLGVVFTSFILLAIILVPPNIWAELATGIVSVGNIPPGLDPVVMAAWWGYIGLATGLNYYAVSWFKDKGYGMSALTGYIPALVGGKKIEISTFGKIFKLNTDNLKIFKRWTRLALEELFVIFFLGAIIGMLVPMTLAYAIAKGYNLSLLWGIPLWLSQALNTLYGPAGYWWGVLVAVFVLFKTQLGIVDAIVRNFADAAWKLEGVRKFFKNDIRFLYYTLAAVILAWASVAFFATAPVALILISANMANAGAIYGVPFLIYLNYKMPKELRLHWGLIVLNIVFMIMCLTFMTFSVGRALGIL